MKQYQISAVAVLLVAGGALPGGGCGTDDDPCGGVTCSDHGRCEEIYGSATCQCDAGFHPEQLECLADDPPEYGTAQVVVADLHATDDHEAQVSLRQMRGGDTVADADLTVYEGVVGGKETPLIGLLGGALAQNLGPLDEFHEIDEVPEDGYVADDEALVIGSAFQSGGTCEGGFIMSKNVFALQLPDGTYAKLVVQSARAGRLELLVYRQPDGSRDTTTRP